MFKEYPEVMSVKQAAEALHICTKSIYRLVNENIIASVRIGKKILIPKYALVRYLQSAQYQIKNT